MISVKNVLLSGQRDSNKTATVNPATLNFPENDARWADDVIYTIVVESVVGAPTTALLVAKFQVAQTTTQGISGGDFSHVTDNTYVWADVPSQDWPVTVGDKDSVNRVTVLRIAGGLRHRLVLTPTFTGGTAPAFVLSAECTTRGN